MIPNSELIYMFLLVTYSTLSNINVDMSLKKLKTLILHIVAISFCAVAVYSKNKDMDRKIWLEKAIEEHIKNNPKEIVLI